MTEQGNESIPANRSDWWEALRRLGHEAVHAVEQEYDEFAGHLRERLGRTDPVVIQPYRGLGTRDMVRISGRVLEDEGIRDATAADTPWQNILAMYLRFESDEVPGARVRASVDDGTGEIVAEQVVTDEEGYFEVRLDLSSSPPPDTPWQEVKLELLEGPGVSSADVTRGFTGLARVPDPAADFGVISDIDDTILESRAARLLTLARSTLLGNAHSRLPFAGVDAFYRALERGPRGSTNQAINPFFYVSSSPWNLYDFLEEFFEINGLPAGPLMLRDLGIDATKFIKTGHDHKLEKIERILAAYPDLPFVLIGDSGQEDPEIYREAVDHFPGRIRTIYIRHVADEARSSEIGALIEEVAEHDIEMLLAEDTLVAARHAVDVGLIHPEQLAEIVSAVEVSAVPR